MATAGRAGGRDFDGASKPGSYQVTTRLAGGPDATPNTSRQINPKAQKPVVARGQTRPGEAQENHRSRWTCAAGNGSWSRPGRRAGTPPAWTPSTSRCRRE